MGLLLRFLFFSSERLSEFLTEEASLYDGDVTENDRKRRESESRSLLF